MPTIPKAPWQEDPIGYLVAEKFPFLREPPSMAALWAAELIDDPSPNGRLFDRLVDGPPGFAAAEAYREELAALPQAHLDALIAEARRRGEEERLRELADVEQRRPFNQPNATSPDYEHWAKHSYWTTDEIVALSLGREPSLVAWANIETMVDRSEFARAYANRREIVRRATVAGQLGPTTTPGVFLAWAQRMRVELPAALREAIMALGEQIRDWKSVSDELQKTVDELRSRLNEKHAENLAATAAQIDHLNKVGKDYGEVFESLKKSRDEALEQNSVLTARLHEREAAAVRVEALGPRERDSLLRLVIGMAVKKYRFDAAAARNAATGRISSDLQEVGVPLDDDTIRKYLAEGRELLPSDPTAG